MNTRIKGVGVLLAVVLLASMVRAEKKGGAEEQQLPTHDAALLRRAGIGTDDVSLIAFLKQRASRNKASEHARQLIQKLNSDLFEVREKATKDLIELEEYALEELRAALKLSDSPEVLRRLRRCIRECEWRTRACLSSSAIRLLLEKESARTVEALIQYLPAAEEPAVEEDIYYGIDAWTTRTGKIDPALDTASSDPEPKRRALAACILGRVGNEVQRKKVRELLKDKSPWVRLRAAQGMLAGRDKSSIPVLIDLLSEKPVSLAWQAEELLHWAAQGDAPEPVIGSGKQEERRRCAAAWEKWWKEHEKDLDLGKKPKQTLCPGLYLIEGYDHLSICGCDQTIRWTLKTGAMSKGRLLPNDEVLLLEMSKGKVVKCNLEGKVIWECDITSMPQDFFNFGFPAHPLRNGNVLVLSKPKGEEILEVVELNDRGKRLSSSEHNIGRSFRREYAFSRFGELVLLERREIVMMDFPTSQTKYLGLKEKDSNRLSAIWNGNVMVSDSKGAYEINREGRIVWHLEECDGGRPWGITCLRNGNYLVVTLKNQHEGKVRDVGAATEVDRSGKPVWDLFKGAVRAECFSLVRVGFTYPKDWSVDSVEGRIQQLKSTNPRMRLWAALSLRKKGAIAERAVPALINALDTPDYRDRYEIVASLVIIGPAVLPYVAEALKDRRTRVRAGALYCLEGYWDFKRHAYVRLNVPVDPFLQAICKALKDDELAVRKNAVSALGAMGPKADPAVPLLIPLLKDKMLSREAVIAIGRIGPGAASATPILVKMFLSNDESVSIISLIALGKIGPKACDSLPSLMGAFKNPKYKFCHDKLARDFVQIDPTGAKVAPFLIRILEEHDLPGEEGLILLTLSHYGARGRKAVLGLINAIRGEIKDITPSQAVEAIERLGAEGKDAVPVLIAILKQPKPVSTLNIQQIDEFRIVVIRALGAIGPDAKAALPVLETLVTGQPWMDEDGRVHMDLESIQKNAKRARYFRLYEPYPDPKHEIENALKRIQNRP